MSRSTPNRHVQGPRLGAIFLGVATALMSVQVSAQQAADASVAAEPARIHHYALPPAPLAATLQAIVGIGGREVLYDPAIVAGIRAAALNGEFTVAQALAQALEGTGLSAVEQPDGSVWVTQPQEYDTIVVRARRNQAETSFKVDNSETATRSGARLMDVPGSISIITARMLETQQARLASDALASVGGVTISQNPMGRPDLSIRGFADSTTLDNGVTDPSRSSLHTNIFGVERIEVLKGPQAILSGSNSLGGGVNVVTKKPHADPTAALQLHYGSYGDLTVAGDVGGALSDDERLTYRVIAARTDADESPAGFNGREETSINPQLRWKDENTDLIVGLSYGKQYAPPALFTFARSDGFIMPAPTILVGQKGDGVDSKQRSAYYELEQRITSGIALVSRLKHTSSELHMHQRSGFLSEFDTVPDASNAQADFFSVRTGYKDESTSGDHFLRFQGDTGPVSHKLAVGFSHIRYESRQSDWEGDYVPGVDIYDPAGFDFPPVIVPGQMPFMRATAKSSQLGIYVQDLMSWGDWSMSLNLRRNRYTSSNDTAFYFDDVEETVVGDENTDYSTTPGAGIVYKLSPKVSLYASYAEGYSPQFEPSCGGGFADPQETRNREVGAKFDLLGGMLSMTTAAFELQQSNLLQYDWAAGCVNTLPGQISRGLDFDLQGRIAQGWDAAVNYTYSEVEDKGNPDRIFTGQPRHKFNFWSTYDLQGERWRGLGFGLGVMAASSTNGEYRPEYAFTLPGWSRVDASIFYNRGKWSTILGVKNVFDRLIYDASSTNTYIPIREGRTFMLTVKHDFF